MVYRKLAMDAAAFRRFIEPRRDYPGGPELLAAKIVGRWPDGTPLAVSPGRPDAVDRPATRRGSTTSATPTTRTACAARSAPTSAAPTRATRRASSTGRLTNRHRIVRRGRAYGPPLAPGATEDDGAERGLVFVCFQANIWRQFETIQALWIDDGDPFGLGRDKDFLIGEPHGTAGQDDDPGHPPYFLKPQPRFVTMRGGEYLFQPSMTGLRHLAGLA